MPSRSRQVMLDTSAGPVRRTFRYAFYDWTAEMPKSKRVFTLTGVFIQGYAFYALWSRSLIWPIIWPSAPLLYAIVWVLYMLGYVVVNGMLTSEFFRKTQLEADEIAAQQIQKTLQPDRIEQVPGYDLKTFYKPFRAVGGDYFDVIDLPGNRTLFALADVSGKGMPAALLSSNIQALVRSLAGSELDLVAMASRINTHLSRYTPADRYATAVFIMLSRDSGELSYVNCGHNPPMMCRSQLTTFLEATGLPLGLFKAAKYEARVATIAPEDILLVYTDGLTDSISGDSPEDRLRGALSADTESSLSNLRALLDPMLTLDDVTILLVKRTATAT